MGDFRETERYKRAVEARQAKDYGTQRTLIQEGIRESTGPEKAGWLIMHSGFRIFRMCGIPGQAPLAWEDLREALRVAPEDQATRVTVLYQALALASLTEGLEDFLSIWSTLGTDKRRMLYNAPAARNFGVLRWRQGRWLQARRWFSLSIRTFPECYPKPYRQLAFAYANRGHMSALLGDLSKAAADLAEAYRLCDEYGVDADDKTSFGFFAAEISFANGDIFGARAALQETMQAVGHLFDYSTHACNSMLAARIAYAEENLEGYHYYRDQALTLCEKHGLKLTINSIHKLIELTEGKSKKAGR